MLNLKFRLNVVRPYLWVILTAMFLYGLSYFSMLENKAWASSMNGTFPPIETIPPLPETPNLAKITVIHAAPFSTVITDTAVNICTDAGEEVAGLTGLTYLGTASIFVPPGSFELKVSKTVTDGGPSCITTLIEIDPFTLIDQQEILLILTGDGVNQPFGARLLVTNAGIRRFYLPFIAKPE